MELSSFEFFTLDIEATSIGAIPPRMAVIETADRLKNAYNAYNKTQKT